MNYDCDLQAANLFERTLRGLARVARLGDTWPGCGGGGGNAGAGALARGESGAAAAAAAVGGNAAGAGARPRAAAAAAEVVLEVVAALRAWAEPLTVRALLGGCSGPGAGYRIAGNLRLLLCSMTSRPLHVCHAQESCFYIIAFAIMAPRSP